MTTHFPGFVVPFLFIKKVAGLSYFLGSNLHS